jgi:hypothetical protein
VNAPVTASIPHRLGKEEATRRIKAGFERMRGNLSALVAIDQEEWKGDTLHFNARGFGSTAAGTITVFDDSMRVEVTLPWLLAKMASRLLPTLQKEATLLLEKR